VRRGELASRAAERRKRSREIGRASSCGEAGKEERTRESWLGMGYLYRGQGSQ
jgi:hypothetical protein